jgi:hypothetical protein
VDNSLPVFMLMTAGKLSCRRGKSPWQGIARLHFVGVFA